MNTSKTDVILSHWSNRCAIGTAFTSARPHHTSHTPSYMLPTHSGWYCNPCLGGVLAPISSGFRVLLAEDQWIRILRNPGVATGNCQGMLGSPWQSYNVESEGKHDIFANYDSSKDYNMFKQLGQPYPSPCCTKANDAHGYMLILRPQAIYTTKLPTMNQSIWWRLSFCFKRRSRASFVTSALLRSCKQIGY